jgi:hypothetical protein
MRLNLGLHARHIYRIRRQKRAMLIWIKYFSNLSRNSRKAVCSGWDWHQSEGMAKLTTSLNAFFKTRKSAKRLEISPFAGFPFVRAWSAYPPKLSVTADVSARQPSARSGCEQSQQGSPYSMTSSASASTPAGISRPSARAVLRLMRSSTLVSCRTGRSAGFAPLRMRAAYRPIWRKASKTSVP